MNQLEMKKLAAQAALQYVKADTIVGVGSGSTVNCFIEALGTIKDKNSRRSSGFKSIRRIIT